jgi:hypothetical protein
MLPPLHMRGMQENRMSCSWLSHLTVARGIYRGETPCFLPWPAISLYCADVLDDATVNGIRDCTLASGVFSLSEGSWHDHSDGIPELQ